MKSLFSVAFGSVLFLTAPQDASRAVGLSRWRGSSRHKVDHDLTRHAHHRYERSIVRASSTFILATRTLCPPPRTRTCRRARAPRPTGPIRSRNTSSTSRMRVRQRDTSDPHAKGSQKVDAYVCASFVAMPCANVCSCWSRLASCPPSQSWAWERSVQYRQRPPPVAFRHRSTSQTRMLASRNRWPSYQSAVRRVLRAGLTCPLFSLASQGGHHLPRAVQGRRTLHVPLLLTLPG